MGAQRATIATAEDIGRVVTLVSYGHSGNVHVEVSGLLNAVATYPDLYGRESDVFLHIGAETFRVTHSDALTFRTPRAFPVLNKL